MIENLKTPASAVGLNDNRPIIWNLNFLLSKNYDHSSKSHLECSESALLIYSLKVFKKLLFYLFEPRILTGARVYVYCNSMKLLICGVGQLKWHEYKLLILIDWLNGLFQKISTHPCRGVIFYSEILWISEGKPPKSLDFRAKLIRKKFGFPNPSIGNRVYRMQILRISGQHYRKSGFPMLWGIVGGKCLDFPLFCGGKKSGFPTRTSRENRFGNPDPSTGGVHLFSGIAHWVIDWAIDWLIDKLER